MKILVTHPAKQYVHQLMSGLLKFSEPELHTTIWYKPGKQYYKLLTGIPVLGSKLKNELEKRYQKDVPEEIVRQHPLPELKRYAKKTFLKEQTPESFVFARDRHFDNIVAHELKADIKVKSIVSGFEMACRDTFELAQSNGIPRVLELAQIHYKEIAEIAEKYPVFGKLFEDRSFRNMINKVKQEEYDLSTKISCLSGFAKESLLKHGIPEEKIEVANLGFDPDTFVPKQQYKKNGTFKLVFSGTITRRKGIDLLIKAFEELKLPDAELIFIGPVADGGDLLANTGDSITHLPFLHHQELNDRLRDCDLFVFPSYLDSWAMVVVEAMACGLPVIVSENTGAKDAVNKGGGFVISPESDQLKEKIVYFYENREQLEIYGKEARKVAEIFAWNNYYQQVKKIYSSLA